MLVSVKLGWPGEATNPFIIRKHSKVNNCMPQRNRGKDPLSVVEKSRFRGKIYRPCDQIFRVKSLQFCKNEAKVTRLGWPKVVNPLTQKFKEIVQPGHTGSRIQ